MNPVSMPTSVQAPPGEPRATRPSPVARWFRLFGAWLGLIASLQAAPLERVTLQLKWRHQFQFAGYYAAQEKGYYRDAGLDVKITEAEPGMDPIKEVTGGRAQYGVSNSGLLLAREAGQPVVVLAVIFQHSPFLLIARAASGINSIHDLVGRRVMLERHSEEILAYLKKEGVPLQSLHLQEHSFDSADLPLGKVDALSAYSTDEPYLLDRAGFRYLAFTPRSDGIDFYGDNLFTTEGEIRSHPARVKAFREASLKGWKFAMQHREEMVELILAKYGQWHSRDHLLYEARQMEPLMQPSLIEMGYMHAGRWQHIAETYAELGLLPRTFSLQGFIYDPDADERLARRRMKLALTLVLPIGALLGVLALIFLRLNRRLTRAIRAQAEMSAVIQGNERRFRFLAEQSTDVIWRVDVASGRFTYVSPSVLNQLGYTPEELMSRPAVAALTPESAAYARSALSESMAEWRAGRQVPPRVLEVDQPHKDGHLVPTETVATLHTGSEGQMLSLLGVSRDITERRRAEEHLRQEVESLEQLASTDLLTGAWNRRHFHESVEGEMHRSRRYGHPLSLMLLDIDHFKVINDTYGHPEGDRVLRQVADRVRTAIRVSDSLTRWGGEEFIVLMPNTGLSSAMVLAERVRESIAADPFDGVGPVTASIGLADYLPSASREDWLERADQAMYKAKHGGRNRVEADPARSNALPTTEHLEGTFLKLVWNETYRCGNPTIDAQHGHLFHRSNDLLDAVLSGRPADEISAFVTGLLAEVIQHFHDEEKILTDRNFPGLVEHAKLHADLVAKTVDLQQAFRDGTLSVGGLFQFLAQDVVASHLLKADREFFYLMADS